MSDASYKVGFLIEALLRVSHYMFHLWFNGEVPIMQLGICGITEILVECSYSRAMAKEAYVHFKILPPFIAYHCKLQPDGNFG
uniref:Uncharacterized protein n=1 Tax=Setaria viridis TaxID=4556 RepID=A0A4U6TUQ0_SETVI|nr:hypothetical protein SEVIR_7G163403v2 [Setaria viridis]